MKLVAKNLLSIGAMAAAVFATSCRPRDGGSDVAAVSPATTRPGWIKSPEAIEGTITTAWGLELTSSERWKYIQSVHSMLGGTVVLSHRSMIDQPNGLYVLALDNLSGWLAGKLAAKQATQAGEDAYLFGGLGLSGPDTDGCFKDDSRDWCDFNDGVTSQSLSKNGLSPQSLSKEWRKRLMHNIQDIGEFMLLSIDNTLTVPDDPSGRHAAAFLLDEILVPSLPAGVPTAEDEEKAWANVIHTILMSGGFYLEAPPNGSAPTH